MSLSKYLIRGYLGNLRVRISGTHGKKSIKIFLKFCFGLKRPKLGTPQMRGEVARALLKSMCPFTSPKFPFIPRTAVLFSTIVLLFSKSPIFFSRNVFLFLKYVPLFSRITLQFFGSALFLFSVCVFFKTAFFPADCTFSFCSELLREISFVLLLFCFLLELFVSSWNS